MSDDEVSRWLEGSLRTERCDALDFYAGKDFDTNRVWMDKRGFCLVMDVLHGGFVNGFDQSAEYEFMRVEWHEPCVFRLVDCDPAFNIWGLRFRPLDMPAPNN